MKTCSTCGKELDYDTAAGILCRDNEYGVCPRCFSHFIKSNYKIFEEWATHYLITRTKPKYASSPTAKKESKDRAKAVRVAKKKAEQGVIRAEVFASSVVCEATSRVILGKRTELLEEERANMFEKEFIGFLMQEYPHISEKEALHILTTQKAEHAKLSAIVNKLWT